MPDDLNRMRKEMAAKARRKCSRQHSFSRELPADWGPQRIVNPNTGLPFSDDSAWHLIADLLEDENQEVKVIELKKPPGKKAIEILYDFDPTQPYLYIKVHLGANKVIGRSFHLSIYGRGGPNAY